MTHLFSEAEQLWKFTSHQIRWRRDGILYV